MSATDMPTVPEPALAHHRRPRVLRLVAPAGEDLRSLYRTGNALVVSVGVTSGVGVVYWLLAAHLYSRRTVGLNAAAVSVMMLLAGVSQLNLASTMARFVPRAGSRTRVLVRAAYAVSIGVA